MARTYAGGERSSRSPSLAVKKPEGKQERPIEEVVYDLVMGASAPESVIFRQERKQAQKMQAAADCPYKIEMTERYIVYRVEQDGKEVIHREKGPAIIHRNGERHYYHRGEYHNVKGSAVDIPNGDQFYYHHGRLLVCVSGTGKAFG